MYSDRIKLACLYMGDCCSCCWRKSVGILKQKHLNICSNATRVMRDISLLFSFFSGNFPIYFSQAIYGSKKKTFGPLKMYIFRENMIFEFSSFLVFASFCGTKETQASEKKGKYAWHPPHKWLLRGLFMIVQKSSFPLPVFFFRASHNGSVGNIEPLSPRSHARFLQEIMK